MFLFKLFKKLKAWFLLETGTGTSSGGPGIYIPKCPHCGKSNKYPNGGGPY